MPARPFLQEVGADPGRLRIGFTAKPFTDAKVHADCVNAVHDVANLCADLGHEVVEGTFELPGELLTQAFVTVWSALAAWSIDGMALITGCSPTQDQFEPLTWALAESARQQSSSAYLLAVTMLQMFSREIARLYQDFDTVLTPTLAWPPPPLGTFFDPPENPWQGLLKAAEFIPFTPLCNFTGRPGMSVPLYWNSDGLPVGTHFVGRFGDEATLFRLAAQLETARPWAGNRPPVSA